MSDFSLFIHGHGAVSSAGIGPAQLYQACLKQTEIQTTCLERNLGEETVSYTHRPVNGQALLAAMPKHPRIRRASNVTKFAVTAAYQAIGTKRLEQMKNGELNIGIILTLLNGCVNYSNRFFSEVLEDPALASPILFPETVFNAPASHIAAYLGCDGPAYTLLGDSATWFSAISIADAWIADGQVDGCLILCSEEIDWLTIEGLRLYSRDLVPTEGAAAIYLEARPSEVALTKLYGPFSYNDSTERRQAHMQAWASQETSQQDILIDGLSGTSRFDRDELAVTTSWSGARLSPARILGEGMGIRCGFQTITAIEALLDGRNSASVFAGGGNQHAFSARFTRMTS